MASSSYWYFLIALATASLIARLAVDALPLPAISYRPGRGEAIFAAGSVLALIVHCTAMFFPAMPEMGRAGGLIGPAVDVPADAPAQVAFLAALGRHA